ncbi:unnamed protein product [Caenorhabditis auriculariae]|uniref:G protein-coupled receptor n=1 Tax=Caenorhabditis auriculariae TaxID=2777116 RepID=A0A8S1H761_9PELO|nr:unnamed protein product [Caenorhabditis auriculariae]
MSIERSLATYRIQSQSQNSSFDGYFILSLMIAAGLGVTTFAYRRFSLSSLSIFCTTSTTETINDVTTVTLLLALCDVIAFIYTVVLYFINARQKGKLTYGNIEVKSQRMENDAAYKLLMPLIVFHLTFFLTFNLAVASLKKLKHLFSRESDFQVFISSLYVVPIYTFVSPLIMQHIMVRGARLRKEKLQQVVFGVFVTIYSHHKYNMNSFSIFCMSSSAETLNDVTSMSLLLAICDLIAFLYTVVLYFINARQKRRLSFGNLQVKSQRMENEAAYKLLMPLIVFHLLFFLSFNLAVGSLKKLQPLFTRESDFHVFITSLYVIPIYTFVSPLIMQHIMVRGARLRREKLVEVRRIELNENDTYFNMYRDMWQMSQTTM